jgi:pimeloyl-ACP methyl ester carboxylesterase
MKFLKILGLIIGLLIIVYLFGPKPEQPVYSDDLPPVPAAPAALVQYVAAEEAQHHLKPDNEARIIWCNDSARQKTPWSVVYLHGFSASQEEGDPVHINFARDFGCNLYLSRLAEHGIDTTEPLASFTAEKLWNSAKEALAIGKQLGEKVILMSTSTGGTMALKLAADFPDDVAALILLSPNIEINNPSAWMLNNPWGLQIAHLMVGKYNTARDSSAAYKKYWNYRYRMEATVQLEQLLETTMKESTFQKVRQPALLLYYFKDEDHQDPVVKVTAMKRMFRQLGTPDSLKREVPIPEAGDHVIASYIKSKDFESVQKECERFALEILHVSYARH